MPIPRCSLLIVPLLIALPVRAQMSAGADEPDLRTVPFVDLTRYMGKWYVISHVPNLLEKGKVGTSDNYTLLPDGTLLDVFKFRKHSLTAEEKQWSGPGWVTNTTTNASWKVRLIWPFKSDYLVLELDPNYGWAVVSSGSGKLIWVLSRTPSLDPITYSGIRERLRVRHLDPAKLELVPQ